MGIIFVGWRLNHAIILLLSCPIYGLLGINWMIEGRVKNKLWAWNGIGKNLKFVKLIALSFL